MMWAFEEQAKSFDPSHHLSPKGFVTLIDLVWQGGLSGRELDLCKTICGASESNYSNAL